MSTIKGQRSIWYYINCIIALVIMFGFKFIPASPPMTQLGMNVLGILIGAIYAWCTVDIIWPSILALIALGLTGYTTVPQAFTQGFGHQIVLFVFFLFIISAMVEESGLINVMANWMVSRKIAIGRPWVLTSLILLAAFIGAAFVSLIPAILICWALLYNICDKAGFKKGDAWPSMMVFAIAFIANIGVVLLPFQVGVVTNFGFLAQASKGLLSYSYSSYLLYSLIYCILITVGFILVFKYIFRPDVTPLLKEELVLEQNQKLNGQQITTLIIFGIMIIILMVPSFLPKGNFIRDILDQMGQTAAVALMVGVASFLRFKGKPFINVIKLIQNGVGWNIIFMLAAAFSFAGALTSDKAGLVPMFMKMMDPIFAGHGAYMVMIIFIIITVILTNIINHTVVSAIMIPIAYALSGQMGVNPIAITALMVFVVDFGILFPSSSVTGAVLHGNTEWISSKHIIKYGLVSCAYMLLMTVVFGVPLVNHIFH